MILKCKKAKLTELQAKIRLAKIMARYKVGNRREIRIYKCNLCDGWHLTSQEDRKDINEKFLELIDYAEKLLEKLDIPVKEKKQDMCFCRLKTQIFDLYLVEDEAIFRFVSKPHLKLVYTMDESNQRFTFGYDQLEGLEEAIVDMTMTKARMKKAEKDRLDIIKGTIGGLVGQFLKDENVPYTKRITVGGSLIFQTPYCFIKVGKKKRMKNPHISISYVHEKILTKKGKNPKHNCFGNTKEEFERFKEFFKNKMEAKK